VCINVIYVLNTHVWVIDMRKVNVLQPKFVTFGYMNIKSFRGCSFVLTFHFRQLFFSFAGFSTTTSRSQARPTVCDEHR
jgi:hypothetical protein